MSLKLKSLGLLLLLTLYSGSALPQTPVTRPYIGYSDYQIVTDFSFNAAGYFQKMKSYGVNFQRIWVLGYSNTDKKLAERMPFKKIAGDYDLDLIDPVYIQRLRKVLSNARIHNQRVMLTLFDRWSLIYDNGFTRTPWYHKNNSEGLLKTPFPQFYTLVPKKIGRIHENYVREIVSATKEFHPIYEIMNQARRTGSECGSLNKWHNQVAGWILAVSPNAEIAININDECPATFQLPWVDMISLHSYAWKERGICQAIQRHKHLNKHLMIDTDGAFRERGDNNLVRQWIQEAIQCGASFNHKDDIYDLDHEALTIFQQIRFTQPLTTWPSSGNRT